LIEFDNLSLFSARNPHFFKIEGFLLFLIPEKTTLIPEKTTQYLKTLLSKMAIFGIAQ